MIFRMVYRYICVGAVLTTLSAQIAHADLSLSGELSGFYPRVADYTYPFDDWVEDFPYNGDIVLENANITSGDGAAVAATGRIVLGPGFTAAHGSAFRAQVVEEGTLIGALAIVTTNEIVSSSEELQNYAFFKRQSRPVYIVTEDRLFKENGTEPNGWAKGLDLSEPSSRESSSKRANSIRNWLKSNYRVLGINYVLLIGDKNPDGGDVPMKNFVYYKDREQYCYWNPQHWDYFRGMCTDPINSTNCDDCEWRDVDHVERTLVTDYYYSNLTFDYKLDSDGDETYFIGMNLSNQDVHVGRIPVLKDDEKANDIETLDKVLRKFINYGSETNTAWRNNAMLAIDRHNKKVSGDMVPFGESVTERLLIPIGMGYHRVYEPYTLDDGSKIEGEEELIDLVSVGNAWLTHDFGLVFWYAHGSSTGATDIINVSANSILDYTPMLDDSHPAFVVSASCNNSNPRSNRNVGAALLQNGAIAFLGASGVSWPGFTDINDPYNGDYASSLDLEYGYMEKLIEDGLPAGAALSAVRTRLWHDVISKMPNPNPWVAWVEWDKKKGFIGQQLLFNLYGDPTLGIWSGAYRHY